MKHTFLLTVAIFALIFNTSCSSDDEHPAVINPTSKMEWWEEARFGLFIHWGLYSVWEGKYQGQDVNGQYIDFDMRRDGGGVGAEWMQRIAKIPTDTYLSRLNEFNSSNFDPNQIAQLAKDAGMKYVIITSKHHEGFCLWDSKHDPINITKTQADVNILKKLKKACYDKGLKFGVYFSQNYDWSIEGGFGQEYYKTYTKEEHEEYIDKYVLPVLDELFTNLDPDILWWDIPSGNTYPDLAEKIYLYVEEHGSKKLITNDRLSQWHPGDIAIVEDDYGQGSRPYTEICTNLNQTWGYGSSYDTSESDYIGDYNLIFSLIVSPAAKGRNSLINISPKGDGSIPRIQLDKLKTITNWMSKNGKAIHNTSRALYNSNQTWGRITKSNSKNELYLIIASADQSIFLDGIETSNLSSITTPDGMPVVYRVDADDRVFIPDFRKSLVSNLPITLVAKYTSRPVILDYTYVDKTMSCFSFLEDGISGKAMRLNGNKESTMVAWWHGEIYSRIKFNGESGNYKLRMILDEAQWRKIPTFTISIDGNTAATAFEATTTSDFDKTFTLEKGHIYNLKITKTDYNQSWVNFKSLEFIKE